MIDFAAYGLGMGRDQVSLLPHDPRWSAAFALIQKSLHESLPASSLALHHIGSTAIPGIHAKPILDILGIVPSIEAFGRERPKLESLGFTWKGEHGIPGRRYSVLYSRDGQSSCAHLHVFENGHPETETHLLFRNHLRAHPETARAYDALKSSLKVKFSGNRELYTEAKAAFIQSVLGKARP